MRKIVITFSCDLCGTTGPSLEVQSPRAAIALPNGWREVAIKHGGRHLCADCQKVINGTQPATTPAE